MNQVTVSVCFFNVTIEDIDIVLTAKRKSQSATKTNTIFLQRKGSDHLTGTKLIKYSLTRNVSPFDSFPNILRPIIQ